MKRHVLYTIKNGYKHGNQSGGIVPIDSAYVEGEIFKIKKVDM